MTTMAETIEGTGEVAGVIQSNGVAQQNGGAQGNGKKRKLHGRAFYESIGSPKLVLAPMVEQSEFVCLFSSVKLDLRWWLTQSF
jgi:tRNA-dihydrouridine synthase 1